VCRSPHHLPARRGGIERHVEAPLPCHSWAECRNRVQLDVHGTQLVVEACRQAFDIDVPVVGKRRLRRRAGSTRASISLVSTARLARVTSTSCRRVSAR
jgi:hypothetical protein